MKNNLETVEIVVDVSATAVAFFGMTWSTSIRRYRCCCCGEQLVTKKLTNETTELSHVIPRKATAVAETSTIISTVSRMFFDEFLHFNHVFEPMSLFKE